MKNLVYAVAISALTVLCAAPTFVSAASPASYDVAASNWKFAPGVITVHVGETTTLRVTSKEGVHSIGSSDLGIPETVLTPGKYVTLTFTPKKAGTYQLHCALPCGPGHPDMMLVVKVVQ